MASAKLPAFVDLIRRHGAFYARNACGLHVPIETLDADDCIDALTWLIAVSPAVADESVHP